jgi:hypothetical protein
MTINKPTTLDWLLDQKPFRRKQSELTVEVGRFIGTTNFKEHKLYHGQYYAIKRRGRDYEVNDRIFLASFVEENFTDPQSYPKSGELSRHGITVDYKIIVKHSKVLITRGDISARQDLTEFIRTYHEFT